MKIPLSIVIPIRNEASNLERCLSAVQWADEIWVVDSQSSDASVDIAQKNGARVVQFYYNGSWPKKKNWALETLPFKHDWVFLLDADEVLPPEAMLEIGSIVGSQCSEICGYWINRRFMFMGSWLKHAYYPNWNLRLFKHALGRFEQLVEGDTRSGDNEVHEHVILNGISGRLKCEMDHYAFPDIFTFVEKHNRYSNWEACLATQALLDGKGVSRADVPQSFRRWLKKASLGLPFRPWLRFCYVYFIQKGFLDGIEGFYFARLHSFYEFLCVAKEREIRRSKR